MLEYEEYRANLARFICCLLEYDYSDERIFELGYQNTLIPLKQWNKRKKEYVTLYPLAMDFILVLADENIGDDVFNQSWRISDVFGERERFYRLFNRWEYTVRHYNRYVMQRKAILED